MVYCSIIINSPTRQSMIPHKTASNIFNCGLIINSSALCCITFRFCVVTDEITCDISDCTTVINRSANSTTITRIICLIIYKISCNIADCTTVINRSAYSRGLVTSKISSNITDCTSIIDSSAVFSRVFNEIARDIADYTIVIIINSSTTSLRCFIFYKISCNITDCSFVINRSSSTVIRWRERFIPDEIARNIFNSTIFPVILYIAPPFEALLDEAEV